MSCQTKKIVIFSFMLTYFVIGCGLHIPTPSAVSNNESSVKVSQAPPSSDATTMSNLYKIDKAENFQVLIQRIDEAIAKDIIPEEYIPLCLFMKANALRRTGNFSEAEKLYRTIIKEYPEATVTVNLKDISEKAEKYNVTDLIEITIYPLCEIGLKLIAVEDEGRFSGSSEDYVRVAWLFYNKKMYDDANYAARTCINTFSAEAKKQQEDHKNKYQNKDELPYIKPDFKDKSTIDILKAYWALYDVGTCYYIYGQTYQKKAELFSRQNQNSTHVCELYKCAYNFYDIIIEKYYSAQCFDPFGPWYWSVCKAAKQQKEKIENQVPSNCDLKTSCKCD
jgi:tetratricopeptide (TPR) repeat protein